MELQTKYKNDGYLDIPFECLFSACGVGGTNITQISSGRIVERMKKDIQHAYIYAQTKGLQYKPFIVWIQGENDMKTPIETYIEKFNVFYDSVKNIMKSYNIYNTPIVSYQTEDIASNSYYSAGQNSALAQYKLDNDIQEFHLAYPLYDMITSNDYVHMTNASSRSLGMKLGYAIYNIIESSFTTLKVASATITSPNNVCLLLNKPFVLDVNHTAYQPSENYGFNAYDANGTSVITGVTIDENYINIACSSTPNKITYGILSETSTTVGGAIREAIEPFKNSQIKGLATFGYMPCFIIEL